MRRSIGGFVTGVVGILIALPIAFYSYIVLALILGLSGFEELAYSVYSFLISGVFAIIAVCFYFSKARIGGILMLIATILYIIPFICGIYVIFSIGGVITDLLFALIIGNIPTILLLISAILGLRSKTINKINIENKAEQQ